MRFLLDIFVIDVSAFLPVVVVAVAAEIVQMLLLAVMAMMTKMMTIGTVTKSKMSLVTITQNISLYIYKTRILIMITR